MSPEKQLTITQACSISAVSEMTILEALDRKLLIARDRIKQVARDETPGFYWHGRPGTGKTHTVIETLAGAGAKYSYQKGYVTPQGLLELLEEYREGVVVLDDVSALFGDKKAVQYLMAALGRMGGKSLPMGYVRQGKQIRFDFNGGIICISNLAIENKGMLAAFKSRVRTLQHSPSDEMLIALCRQRICNKGWPASNPRLLPKECEEVIAWVWTESRRLKVPVDLRVLLEKAMPDFWAWRERRTEADWHDLVTTTLEEEVTTLHHTPPGGLRCGVRRATKEQEQEIVRAVLAQYAERADRIRAWKERTKALGREKSERAFERRWAEIKALDGQLSEVSELSVISKATIATEPTVSGICR